MVKDATKWEDPSSRSFHALHRGKVQDATCSRLPKKNVVTLQVWKKGAYLCNYKENAMYMAAVLTGMGNIAVWRKKGSLE